MSKTLEQIAQQLKDTEKQVQLIYAFNGTGKTRLSLALKKLIILKNNAADETEQSRIKFLYYNAFTEDLFYWDNDLEGDAGPTLKIQSNDFTDWVLKNQGLDQRIITNFQHYANDKLTPAFNEEYKVKDEDGKEIVIPAFSEVTFSLERGDDTASGKIKISKGEESNFIWSIFYTLLDQVTGILNVAKQEERETDQFNELEYVFIDDPVSSLDENHLIELAVNLAELIKSAPNNLKFIITTHNPLFYNVLCNELKSQTFYLLERFEDGTFALQEKKGASNKSFSYHLYLKQIIEKAIENKQVEKFHFTLLRNLYEKTACFLGYERWSDLLDTDDGDKKAYLKHITNFSSHRTLSGEEVRDPTGPEKQVVNRLFYNLINNYSYWREKKGANDSAN